MSISWSQNGERNSADDIQRKLSDVSEVNVEGFQDRPDWPLSQNVTSSPISAQSPALSTHKRFEETGRRNISDSSSFGQSPYGSSTNSRGFALNSQVQEHGRDGQVRSRSVSPTEWEDEVADGAEKEKEQTSKEQRQISAQVSRNGSLRIQPRDSTQSQGVSPAKVSPIQAEFNDIGSRSRSPSIAASDFSVTKREVNNNVTSDATNSQRELPDESEKVSSNQLSQSTEADSLEPAKDDIPAETQRTQPEDITAAEQNKHKRMSSIAKNSLSGYHSRQSSYNRYSTTQIPANRDRVRYSWQSVQDEGPSRPRIHIIKLVSNTASASSASPQGEAFGFSISPGGRRIAAYNSARLYILQTNALPVGISQDFALKRRPLAVELNDSGSLVAILADAHTVNLYDLANSKLRRTRTVKLDFPTDCIAIAPCGGLLATSYEGGIEVFSLASGALATDRRAVRSPKMDRLAFSEDGSTLLGTTTKINVASTVIVNVPVFPAANDGVPTADELKQAWCSELLHPENIKNSSHAVFMREERTTCNDRVFAWNGLADTFGILNTSDMQYGQTDFPVVISPPLSTCGGLGAAIHTCPVIDEFGETVAMVVNDRTIRLYLIPRRNDDDDNPTEAHSIDHELDEGYGCPFGEVRWVQSSSALPAPQDSRPQVKGRLIVTSPGGLFEQENEESFEEVEGGRIILMDFDAQFAGQPGQTFVLHLGKSPPRPLEEEEFDVDDAVALVRRRTVKQHSAADMTHRPVALGRAATTINNSRTTSRPNSTAIFNRRTASVLSVGSSIHSEATRSLPDLAEGVEQADVMEEPFSMQAPRSQASLQRSASNVQRHRFQTLEERNQQAVTTDNDNFLPLPEYTEEPNAPLPSRFRAMAGLDTTVQPAQRQSMIVSGAAQSSHSRESVPMSAPPSVAENFSANRAFAAANSGFASQNGSPPLSMPRGLLRAYSNAATNIQMGHDFADSTHSTPQTSPMRHSAIDLTSPYDFHPGFAGAGVVSSNTSRTVGSRPHFDHRYSTPLASFSEQQFAVPRRSSSSRRPGEHDVNARQYNMHALRQATATASLFPPAQPTDLVPLPTTNRQQPTGTVAHPVTGWRPPAPSVISMSSMNRPASQPVRGVLRKSSISNKSAFANTAKAKKLGFFKKNKSARGYQPGEEMSMMDDSKSMVTWMTVSDRKCTVM